MKRKLRFYSDISRNYLLLNMDVWSAYQGGEGAEGALMMNLYLISHSWYDVEKLTVPGSSNLNLSFSGARQKVLCKKMKEKCVTFCFIKFNGKIAPKSSVEGWLFRAEVRSLLSKLIFTHFVSCWSCSHEIVEK